MENKTVVFILLSTLLLLSFSLIIAQSNGAPQTDAFWHFQNEKLKKSNDDDVLFDTTELLFDKARLVDRSRTEGQKEKDRIESLPGQPPGTFNQYGGYVTVDQKAGRALYYYFAEAKNSPNTSPLLLWLNGGPGCSSLGYGAMEEIGPFRVYSDGKTLYANEYAWNQVANVLFLESPAGVGFSYSNRTNDNVVSGDKRTALDNYVFLVKWLERFQEYKDRDFYIAGDSYAGHFVPQLATTIVDANKKAGKTIAIINLKGIIIGNAAINYETDAIGQWNYLGSHAIVSDDVVSRVMKYCDFSPDDDKPANKYCTKAVEEADIGNINIYNIYSPLCSNSNLTDKPKRTSVFNFDPCSDNYVKAYLNRRDVQTALHANVTNIPYDWKFCSVVLSQNWTDSPYSVLPLLKTLMNNGLRVWLYSGDVDGAKPVTSTQLAIKEMKLVVQNAWRPWYVSGEPVEVGGYTQRFTSNFTFATVRGAGHGVPSGQPQRALTLISSFLAGKELPGYRKVN